MNLLFVANFPSNTGYAWDTIEAVFRRVGERLHAGGHRVSVCYPSLAGGPPERMVGAPFGLFEFDEPGAAGVEGAMRFARVLRERRIDTLYLTDHPTVSWRYALFRRAGVRTLVVHDRTSGERGTSPLAARAKRALHRVRPVAADVCVGVSDFVRERLVRVGGTPPERTFRVHNGIDLSRFDGRHDPLALHRLLGVPEGTRVVFCSGRAQAYKGIQVVVEAAALLARAGVRDVAFAYCGDGPFAGELRARAAGLPHFHFLGRRGDVPRLLPSASAAVVPSLWAEAFGLSVVEAMAAGVPLVATRTGGIPELVEPGRTGLLVPPGDAPALALALRRLLDDPALGVRMGARARAVARDRFGLDRVAGELHDLLVAHAPPAARVAARELVPA
jgi:glycosyltransferase involved in cell wall biosynthesis